jgi:hypothetical protein
MSDCVPKGSAFRNLSFSGCLSRLGRDWTNRRVWIFMLAHNACNG